jgi:hypothetical protein
LTSSKRRGAQRGPGNHLPREPELRLELITADAAVAKGVVGGAQGQHGAVEQLEIGVEIRVTSLDGRVGLNRREAKEEEFRGLIVISFENADSRGQVDPSTAKKLCRLEPIGLLVLGEVHRREIGRGIHPVMSGIRDRGRVRREIVSPADPHALVLVRLP